MRGSRRRDTTVEDGGGGGIFSPSLSSSSSWKAPGCRGGNPVIGEDYSGISTQQQSHWLTASRGPRRSPSPSRGPNRRLVNNTLPPFRPKSKAKQERESKQSELSNRGGCRIRRRPRPAVRPRSQVRRLGVAMAAKIEDLFGPLLRASCDPLYYHGIRHEHCVSFYVSSSQKGGMNIMVGSSTVHLPTHSSVHHPVVQMVLFGSSFYCPRSMVPKSILDFCEHEQTDTCGNDVSTVYEALWVPKKFHSDKSCNDNAISYACGTVRRSGLSLPVLFDVSMKCEPLVSKNPESKECPGDCCKGYTVSGNDPSTTLQLFAPSNAGSVSDFVQLNCRPDGSVNDEEHQYILKNSENEQNGLLCVFEKPISCSNCLKTGEALICHTECLSMDAGTTLNSSEECHGSQVYVLPLASSEGSSSSTSTLPSPLYLDSGASHHAVGDPRVLCNLRDPPAGAAVRVADGFRLPVTSVGDIQTEDIQIPDVYFVPGLKMNLISVRQLAESKIKSTFDVNHAELFREGEREPVGGAIVDDTTSLYRLSYLKATGNPAGSAR